MGMIVKLAEGQCPTSATDIFTAYGTISLSSIDVANPTGSTQNITLKLNGVILFSVVLPVKGGLTWRGPQIIYQDQKINIVADSASCTYIITGEVL